MIGFRVCQRTRVVPADLVAAYREVPVANVSDCMARMFAGAARLRPMHRGGERLAGPALTVRTRPGDNLMVHKALQLALPGDVIVVDAGGDLTNALIGELMVGQAIHRGVAGFVIHGAIRDAAAIAAGPLPVFAVGVTHRGPYKDGPGEINVPIGFDGLVVEPGDLIVGDEDGVLAIAIDDAAALLAAARAKQAAEFRMTDDIANGRYDARWIDETLAKKGCAFD